MFDHDPVAEMQGDTGHAVEGIEGAIDDGDRFWREWPRRSQLVLQGGQDGVVEVARRQRLAADLGHDRRQIRQQIGVGRARRQIEGEVPWTFADLPVPARSARPGGMADERPVAAAGLDRPHVGEPAPGLRNGRRRDAETARELADGRQSSTDVERSGGDHPADRRRDPPGRPAVGVGAIGSDCRLGVEGPEDERGLVCKHVREVDLPCDVARRGKRQRRAGRRSERLRAEARRNVRVQSSYCPRERVTLRCRPAAGSADLPPPNDHGG